MTRPLLLLAASLALAGWMVFSLFTRPAPVPRLGQEHVPARQSQQHQPLLVYCAASNRAVMEAIARDYQQEYGAPIEFQFGPSQTLLSSIEVSGTGDLYLPADASYLTAAAQRGIVTDGTPLARMQVVLGVSKGNPLEIQEFSDLLKEGCRVVQANPDVAAVGKLTREELTKQGKWDALQQHTTAFVSSVTEAANSVKAGAADVGIVYDAVLTTYPELETVQLEEFSHLFADIKISFIKSSPQLQKAAHFVKYLSASDKGLKRYQEFGFAPVPGSLWTGDPLP